MYTIKGKKFDWEIVIGLETHIEILSKAKAFSGASADYNPDVAPNTQVSLGDAAFPGMLPSLNRECVRQAIKMGLGLNAEISRRSTFSRKHYFYQDLPAGYQITQPAGIPPIVGRGYVEIIGDDGAPKKIFIERAHLEQDAGKNKFDAHPAKTFVDLNRVGVGLLEIVTFLDTKNPDNNSFITSPDEAEKYLRELRSIARALGVSHANMEEGSIRADINISIRPVGEKTFRTRTETKNMVSFKFIKTAIEYEARRQVEIFESGGQVSQDTMHYDQDSGTTRVMRSNALDYRYFPEPNILPLVITDDEIEDIRKTLPELPAARKKRYAGLGLSEFDANRIAEDNNLYEFFDAAVADRPANAKAVSNWLLGDLAANPEYKMTPAHLAELVEMIQSDEISGKIAKEIFAKMVCGETGSPREIANKFGLKQTTDTAAIEASIDGVLAANGASVAEYKSGKTGILGFLVGQVMKSTEGKANPKIVNDLLAKKLAE